MKLTKRFALPLLTFLGLLTLSCGKLPIKFIDQEKGTTESSVIGPTKTDEIEGPKEVPAPKAIKHSAKVRNYCEKIDKSFKRWGWKKSDCLKYDWHHVRNSVKGDPLIWVTYGNENEHKKKNKDMTLVMCGVHGDEITPVKFCFDIMRHLESHKDDYQDKLIAVAPIVNPDSYFKRRPTRTNARGVDINRNFPTKDWHADAHRIWKHRYGSDKRRNPGVAPVSEPEVLFQVNLIKRYKPTKIISVHAPLTMLDYDGPEMHDDHQEKGILASQLLIQMSRQASGYKIRNYPFFPGSLGNYAGNERKIPTYTLELPSSDPRLSAKFWNLFKEAIHSALLRDFRAEVAMDQKEESSEPVN